MHLFEAFFPIHPELGIAPFRSHSHERCTRLVPLVFGPGATLDKFSRKVCGFKDRLPSGIAFRNASLIIKPALCRAGLIARVSFAATRLIKDLYFLMAILYS